MTDQLSPPWPDRDSAASDLEYALTDIESACTLLSNEDDAGLARHLGRQIEGHYSAAWDAYCRIFGLDHQPRRRWFTKGCEAIGPQRASIG
jgi:hypothetical protein